MKSRRLLFAIFAAPLSMILLISANAHAYSLGPTKPGVWGDGLKQGTSITWSLMPTGTQIVEDTSYSGVSFGEFLTGDWVSVVENAFNAWSDVAWLTFTQVSDDGAGFNAATISGDIRLGGHVFDGQYGTLAHGYYPPANGYTAAGDIHMDTAENWKLPGESGGIDFFTVLVHEIGHALGLGHSTVAGSIMYPYYSARNTLQVDDIAGIQHLYGAASTPAPEPATLILFGVGMAGLGLLRRNQK